MVNLDKINKNKYYKYAELLLQEEGLSCFKVDCERFGVLNSENKAKIYLLPFTSKTVTREELFRAKQLDNFFVINDRYTKRKPGESSSLRENAYLLFELDMEDR